MPARVFALESDPSTVILRAPPNWTAVAFFGGLGLLHLTMAATVLLDRVWESNLSAAFGLAFSVVTLVCFVARHEVVVATNRQEVRIVRGVGPFVYVKTIPFPQCQAVRVTLMNTGRHHEACVCLICHGQEFEVPATRTPRQCALLLAMILNVRLIKVYGDCGQNEPARRIEKLLHNDDSIV